MGRNITFEEWTGGASEEEIREWQKTISHRFWIYILLSLIPLVNVVTIGMAIFCYNNYKLLKSHGASNGSNIVRFILLLWGLIIVPIIVVQVLARSEKLGDKVLFGKQAK